MGRAEYVPKRRLSMKQLDIKQKVFSLSGKFTVKDQQENDVYYVEGSFMQIPEERTSFLKYENRKPKVRFLIYRRKKGFSN